MPESTSLPKTQVLPLDKRPRPYYNWSQYDTFVHKGWKAYAMKYIYGQNDPNPAMRLGLDIATMIERDEEQDDHLLEHLRTWLPQYQKKEYEIAEVFCNIPVMGHLDGFDTSPIKIGEYKTGRAPWDQKRVDELEQLTWYVLLVTLRYGVKAEDVPCELTWMPTDWNNGDPKVTGDIVCFETRRTTRDMVILGKNIVDSWKKLGHYVEKEFDSLGL